jgi:hypothetical protein
MIKSLNQKFLLLTLVSFMAIILYSCATSQFELTSSWTSKTATLKKSPLIMVLVIGKKTENRKAIEDDMVARLKRKGNNAIASLDLFQPDIQKYDSVALVSLLRKNKIDMILINALVSVTEKERYVPGESQSVQVPTYATPNNPNYYYNNPGYSNTVYVGNTGNFYNYYNNYEATYEKRFVPGQTVIDVTVVIESNLYDVAKPELIWYGQSKTFTKEPSVELFEDFSKIIIDDIIKNKLLLK